MKNFDKLRSIAEKRNLDRKSTLLLVEVTLLIFDELGVSSTSDEVKTVKKIGDPFFFKGRTLTKENMSLLIKTIADVLEDNGGSADNILQLRRIESLCTVNLLNGHLLKDFVKYLGNEVGILDISSVETLDDINVDNGTLFEDVPLPVTVIVTLEDDSTLELPVTWDEGTYDGDVADTYTLTGTIDTSSDSKITNISIVEASIDVIVAA